MLMWKPVVATSACALPMDVCMHGAEAEASTSIPASKTLFWRPAAGRLWFPVAAAIRPQRRASGQKIRSDFPELQISSEGSGIGPKEAYCQGNLNGGGKLLHIHTSTGNIELLKRTVSVSDRSPR